MARVSNGDPLGRQFVIWTHPFIASVLLNDVGPELKTQNPTRHVPAPGTTVAAADHAMRVVVAWPVEGNWLKLMRDVPVVDW